MYKELKNRFLITANSGTKPQGSDAAAAMTHSLQPSQDEAQKCGICGDERYTTTGCLLMVFLVTIP
jgi:hypothetical protein